MKKEKIFFAGAGGQGVLLMGKLLAYAAMEEGKQVTFLPSYGAEMRGGTANCTVIVSDKPISSPVIQTGDGIVAMNLPSLTKFESMVEPGRFLFINSSMIDQKATRTDITPVYVDAYRIAEQIGEPRSANMVMLGAIIRTMNVVSIESIIKSMEHELTGKKAKFLDGNIKALNAWELIHQEN